MKILNKMIIAVLCIIVAAVVCLFALTTANKKSLEKSLQYISTLDEIGTSEDIKVELDEKGFYTITSDHDLKIMQLTDIHIGGGWRSAKIDMKALNAIASMVKTEKPDLVITTGDISFPDIFRSGTFNNQYPAILFASLMNELGVYWVPTFGNHDSESHSKYNRHEMAEFYSRSEWNKCLFQSGDENVNGYGNSVIKVKNSDGVITQAIFTIDSNAYVTKTGGGYANIHESQIEWYKAMCESLNAENKAIPVKSLVFMHIPPYEYKLAWDEFKANGYKDTENVKYYYGTLGENVCHPENEDNFFETALEMESTQGMFVGHDHVNIFSMDYKGIRLTYGMSIDYSAYKGIEKRGTQRGCTIITVKPDGTFDCYPENYYQDKYEASDKETVEMPPLNEEFN